MTIPLVQLLCKHWSKSCVWHCESPQLCHGFKTFFFVNQALDSYWSKNCGFSQLVFALFTRLAQRSTGGSPLWSSGTQVSHSVVRVNEGDCMCLVFLCWLETNTAHNVLWFWSYYFKHSGKSTGMCTLNSGCQFKSGYLFWSSSTPCMKESKLLAVSFSFNSNNFRSAQWHSFLYMAFDVKFCRTVF